MKREFERKVTVEDLVRLKRAERPPADFWVRFDSEMRAKQLSAIVARRPWWDGLHARLFAGISRHPMPIGAVAALALTWAGVRYSGGEAPVAREPQAQAPRALQAAAAPMRAAAPAPLAQKSPAPRSEGSGLVARDESRSAKPVVDATAPHISRPPVDLSVGAASLSPFSDGIAVTMADFREPAPDIARRSVFGTDRDFEPVSAPARPAVADPLARLDPAAERRARLLAPALPAGPREAASDWIRERTASDDRIYESMDRASGDRIQTGFRF